MFKKEEPTIEVFNGQNIQEIYKRMRDALSAGNLRFLLDIDGTLSNSTSNPAEAFVDTHIVELIYQLEKARPGTVTFVTGRPQQEVLGLFKFADKRDLFEVLRKETGRIPNMICNHGKAAFFGDETVEYTMTESQKIFLETAKKAAVDKVIDFAKLNKDAFGYEIINDKSGIKISFDVDGKKTSGYLLELKKDHHGELASFAFHWRILNSLPEKQRKTVIGEFNKIVGAFGDTYNIHDQNPPVVIEGEPGKAPCRYFNLSETSDCVAEFCPSDAHLNKGSMILRCSNKIKGSASDPLYIAMGDSIPGADVELLKAAITLGGLAFIVIHSNKPVEKHKQLGLQYKLTGILHSTEEVFGKANQVNATVKFFRDSGLFDQCLLELMPSTAPIRKGFNIIRSSCSNLPTF